MKKSGRRPAVPFGLSHGAKQWYRRLIVEFEIRDEGGLLLLETAMRAFDRAESARMLLEKDGVVVARRRTRPGAHGPHGRVMMRAALLSTPSTPNQTETLLRDVLTELRAIRAALERQRRPVATLSRGDRELLARMLPAVGGVIGSGLFVARELCESASAALQVVTQGLNARQIGRVLQRGEGQVIDGYVIQREGIEQHAVLWRILQVPEFRDLPVPPVPPRPPGGLA